MESPFAVELLRLGPIGVTDTVVVSLAVSLLLVVAAVIALHVARARRALEVAFEAVEDSITSTLSADVRPLVPLILTQWLFIGVCNLADLLPVVSAPTRDLAVTAALAVIAFLAGHVYAIREQGLAYLRRYVHPSPLLLPFNIIGELSRTIAMALRLFGNMLSGSLVGAVLVYLAGVLVPVPLMLLSVLTGVVQAYIFGVLTLVFAAGSIEATRHGSPSTQSTQGTQGTQGTEGAQGAQGAPS